MPTSNIWIEIEDEQKPVKCKLWIRDVKKP